MFFSNLMALLPTLGIHLVVTLVIAFVAWLGLNKLGGLRLSAWVPVFVGLFFSLFNASSVVIGIYQNRNWAEYQRQQAQAVPLEGEVSELKQKFLAEVEQMIVSPNLITAQSQAALFQRYANLFKAQGEDVKLYAKALSEAYDCEKTFFEDAIASLQKKEAVVSEKQKACEALPGTFFGREKLITQQIIARNQAVMNSVLSGQPLKDAQGNEIQITEEVLKGNLNTQMTRIQALQTIFATK